ncbi:Immature colon carcinoma transcript 1 protein precursor [Daphnia magna]|uniref:Immature colon carcinoma transcript 1 protein n=1 Tax=Daphnia magna TaxID=35525 RepID=A0A164ZXE2_9CRUS|nr:Immature colon carcinoma transcript 1 protein precursor [Daphnia magna]
MAVSFSNFCCLRRLLINSNSCSRAYLSGFKSNLSLEKLYPTSRLDITTIPKAPESKDGKFSGYIPMASADWIPEPIRVKLAERVKNQISKEGYFIIKSERTRSQQLNLADTLDKLRNLIHSVAQSLVVPEVSQETLEKQRRLRERAARERLREKRAHSMTKQGRQSPTLDS